MSGKPDLSELATIKHLRDECERVINHCYGVPRRDPPPHDEEAERLICMAARAGYVTEIDPRDFFSDARAAIFDCIRQLRAAGMERIHDDAIVRIAEAMGWAPVRMRDELHAIWDDPRAVRLEELAERVRACARRRRALVLILRAEAQLRGVGDVEQITDLLVRASDALGDR